ncbi:hypothetical protein WEI85_09565 [Actinomycetes bacterium KLBMP 9797]
MSDDVSPPQWPTDKLTSLRLGRRLVTEVPASGPGRQAFVDIQPVTTAADTDAQRQGWTRSDRDRTFKLQHWDYDADQIDGLDHDIGAVLVHAKTVTGEAQPPQRLLMPLDTRPGLEDRWDAVFEALTHTDLNRVPGVLQRHLDEALEGSALEQQFRISRCRALP